ncbi:ATP/GTP-binding protein, partial [[Kitasatospora] papulosa]
MTATVDFTKPPVSQRPPGRRYVQRAELTLALADQKPLASLGLNPDPLQQLAAAMASVRTESGERADVVLDLVPVRERQLARRRRRLVAQSRRRGPSAYGERLTGGLGGGGVWGAVTAAWSGGKTVGGGRGERLPRMTDLRDGVGKFEPSAGATFAVQLLLRTEAGHPQAALARMNQLLAAFAATSGENYLKPRRPRTRWRVAHFDRRVGTAACAPRQRPWGTRTEEARGRETPPERET